MRSTRTATFLLSLVGVLGLELGARPIVAVAAEPDGAPVVPAPVVQAPDPSDPSADHATEDHTTQPIESSPVPESRTNPIDLLPRDFVYPPNVDVQPKPVIWRREWPRFAVADWIVTGAGGAIALATAIVKPQPKHSYGGVLFDENVRNALRLGSPQARFNARDASDVLLSFEATWPFFVDALITTWWFRGSPDAAGQMALVDGEALAIVTAVHGATNTLVSRERPYGRVCGTPEQPEATTDCEGSARDRSFFSGHSAFTFMSAGLICTHHVQHGLLRGNGDAIACIVAYGGAAATATLRVMADMHYATDVLTGAAVGTAVGLAVPLFHYRRVNIANEVRQGEVRRSLAPVDVSLIPVGAGLGLGGTF